MASASRLTVARKTGHGVFDARRENLHLHTPQDHYILRLNGSPENPTYAIRIRKGREASVAQALLNAACRKYYTARFFHLDDQATRHAVLEPPSQRRLDFLTDLRALDNFPTTPVAPHTAAELLNLRAALEERGSTLVTSWFDPPDRYKLLKDEFIANSIPNHTVADADAETIALDGPNMRRHLAATAH